jgi:hypothetical protein
MVAETIQWLAIYPVPSVESLQVERQNAPCVSPDPKNNNQDKAVKTIPFYHPLSMKWKPCVAPKVTDRGERGDNPREIISSFKTLKTPLAAISRGKCSNSRQGQFPKATARP